MDVGHDLGVDATRIRHRPSSAAIAVSPAADNRGMGNHMVPLNPPIVLAGSRAEVESAMRRQRRRVPLEAGIAVFIFAVCVVFIAIGVTLLTKPSDDPWAPVAVISIIAAAVIGVPATISSLRKAKARGLRVEDMCADPMTVAANARMLPPGFEPVAWPDKDGTDADEAPTYRPIRRILYRPGSGASAVMLCYVPPAFWQWAAGRPDPEAAWGHRHCLAWLHLRVDGGVVVVDALEPIPVEAARHAWNGVPEQWLGEEPTFGGIAGDENLIVG